MLENLVERGHGQDDVKAAVAELAIRHQDKKDWITRSRIDFVFHDEDKRKYLLEGLAPFKMADVPEGAEGEECYQFGTYVSDLFNR